MNLSIITVSLNAEKYIDKTIISTNLRIIFYPNKLIKCTSTCAT